MTDDIEQMRLNQFRKNERMRQKVSNLIDTHKGPKDLHNFRYVLEFDIPAQQLTYGTGRLQFTKTFVARKNRIFTAKSITSATIFIEQVGGIAQRVDAEPWVRNFEWSNGGFNNSFNFEWAIRDSGTDGQWQNAPLPANLLLGGAITPLMLSHGRTLKGGSEVTVDIFVTAMNLTAGFNRIFLQFGIFGVEHD